MAFPFEFPFGFPVGKKFEKCRPGRRRDVPVALSIGSVATDLTCRAA